MDWSKSCLFFPPLTCIICVGVCGERMSIPFWKSVTKLKLQEPCYFLVLFYQLSFSSWALTCTIKALYFLVEALLAFWQENSMLLNCRLSPTFFLRRSNVHRWTFSRIKVKWWQHIKQALSKNVGGGSRSVFLHLSNWTSVPKNYPPVCWDLDWKAPLQN